MSERLTARVIRPGEGRTVPALGMQYKVGAATRSANLLVMEGVVLPGVLVTPHTHTREDECSFILEGSLTYLVGDDVLEATAGSYVPKPRNVRHAFWNASHAPAKVIEVHTPTTFEHYYDRLGAIFESHDPGGAAFRHAFDELAAEHGLVLDWALHDDLNRRYRLGAPSSSGGVSS
jgi:quercetin dioxygenase-like cupin family protein